MTGEEAIAHGALKSNVRLVTGYPGSPSSDVMDTLIQLQETGNSQYHVEWSVNEKVALEVAHGTSIAGLRSMVCVKNVGLNAMLDPLMALNISPVNGGMVVIVGDDPGAYGSQNDQDSRPMAPLMELPWLEPGDPQQAYEMVIRAFDWAEQFQLPIFLRITRSFSLMERKIDIALPSTPTPTSALSLLGDRDDRFVPQPKNAVEKHRELRIRLNEFLQNSGLNDFNIIIENNPDVGIIASGHCGEKLKQVIGSPMPSDGPSVLFLGSVYPIPRKTLSDFIPTKTRVLILEEHQPVIEQQIKSFVAGAKLQIEIPCLDRVGELFRWQIADALKELLPDLTLDAAFTKESEDKEIPQTRGYCTESRYGEVLDLIDEAVEKEGKSPYYIGDPGCLVTVTDRLQVKMAMGGAVAIASGVSRLSPERLVVALFGDSSFFHSTIPAICNAHSHKDNILLILLDNNSALTTGGQPHPGVTRKENGKPLSSEKIALSCGVQHVYTIEMDNPADESLDTFSTAIRQEGLRMVIVHIPSPGS